VHDLIFYYDGQLFTVHTLGQTFKLLPTSPSTSHFVLSFKSAAALLLVALQTYYKATQTAGSRNSRKFEWDVGTVPVFV